MSEKFFQPQPSSRINRAKKRTLQEEYIDREKKLEEHESLEKIKAVYLKHKITSGGVEELMADKVALETLKIEAMSEIFGEAYGGWMDEGEQSRLIKKIIRLVKELENPVSPTAEKGMVKPVKNTTPTRRKEPAKHWLDKFQEREDEKNEANILANKADKVKPTNDQE